jgi:hypothetical protein
VALDHIQPLVSGEIAIGELHRLGPTGIGLSDVRVRDAAGTPVLELQRLDVSWSLRAALSGQVVVPRVEVSGLLVDLADLGSERGLLAALTPTTPAEEEDDEPRADPLSIAVQAIALDAVTVWIEPPGLGRVGVRELSARASYTQGPGREARLESLSCQLLRGDERVGAIDSARAHYVAAGAPSSLAVSLHLGATRLDLTASGLVPGDPAFETAPVEASLRLRQLDGATLTLLGGDAAGEALRQPLDLDVELSGSAGAPRAEFSLGSPAGAVRGEISLTPEREARLQARLERLSLAEWHPELPAGELAPSDSTGRE